MMFAKVNHLLFCNGSIRIFTQQISYENHSPRGLLWDSHEQAFIILVRINLTLQIEQVIIRYKRNGKVVTFLSLKKYGCEMTIPHGCENIPDVSFLGGHTMEELIQAENAATAYALTKAGRMNYTIWIPELNAFTLGQLLFLFEMQTAYAGALLNINTFNQPGVEEGKKATFALLGKAGYAEKKKELDSLPAKDESRII